MKQKYFEIPQIEFDRLSFELKRPIIARGYRRDDQYFLECPMPQMLVWGKDQKTAFEALGFEFAALFKNYALSEDKELTQEAQFVKQQLLFILKDTKVNDPANTSAGRN